LNPGPKEIAAELLTTRWDVLLRVAQQRLDEGALYLVKLAAHREFATAKLQKLLDHRASCQAQLDSARRNAISPELLRSLQSLVASVEHATEAESDRLVAVQKLIFDAEAEAGELHRRIHSYRVMQERQAAVHAEHPPVTRRSVVPDMRIAA
jgi:flagellar biosynthesis chaperone FliJ